MKKLFTLNNLTSGFFYLSILIFLIGFNFTDTPPPSGWYQQFMPNLSGAQITDITFNILSYKPPKPLLFTVIYHYSLDFCSSIYFQSHPSLSKRTRMINILSYKPPSPCFSPLFIIIPLTFAVQYIIFV